MAKGLKALEKYEKEGIVLSPKQAIFAKCAECMGHYADGPYDCELKECPLYPYMPYGSMKKKRQIKMDDESIAKRKERGKRLSKFKGKKINEN